MQVHGALDGANSLQRCVAAAGALLVPCRKRTKADATITTCVGETSLSILLKAQLVFHRRPGTLGTAASPSKDGSGILLSLSVEDHYTGFAATPRLVPT